MDAELNTQDSWILITGGSRGIGAACVRKFVQEGHRVVTLARSEDRLLTLQKELGSNSHRMSFYGADLTKLTPLKQLCRKMIREQDLPRGIVFNAAFSGGKRFSEGGMQLRKREMALNYHSPCAMLDVFLPAYGKQKGGTFIGVGSLSSVTSFPGNASYAASKAAFASLWRSLYHEYANTAHRFGLVMPGLTDTEMAGDMETILPRRSPATIADFVYDNFKNPELEQTLGLENQAALLLNRLAPRRMDQALKTFGSFFLPK